MDWAQIYRTEVLPVLENFMAGPPAWVYGILIAVGLAGLAALIWGPGRVKLVGLVLLFFVGFGAFMTVSSARTAAKRSAEYRTGLVKSKHVEKTVVRNTTGIMEPRLTYWIDVDVSEARRFSAAGAARKVQKSSGLQKIGVGKSLFDAIQEGQTITGVILPTARDHFHFLVLPDGRVIK